MNRETIALHARNVSGRDLVNLVVFASRITPPLPPYYGDPWPLLRLVHRYLTDPIRYEPEPGTQTVRLPSAVVRERVADCKSHAVTVAAVAKSCGLPAVLRFTRYPGDGHFSHVYAVVDGVPVDPLLPFGTEALYSTRIDYPA